MSVTDAVFLLPGFLEFERSGNFSQFADRAAAALRVALEQRLGRSVPVVTIASLPTRSLSARQRKLLSELQKAEAQLGGVERFHLVGYCVGGIDAHLLTCKEPLKAARWDDLDAVGPAAVRPRIRSVVTVGSPLLGMCLASARGAGSLTPKGVLRDPGGALYAAQLVPRLVASALSKVDTHDFVRDVAREGRKVARFAAEYRRFQRLLPALTPESMEALMEQVEPLPGVRRASVVTLTGPGSRDPFFRELSRRAEGSPHLGFGRRDPVLSATRELVRSTLSDATRVIKNPRAELPSTLELTTNDGVVNTCRQVLDPAQGGEVLAAVVADHFDVIGYYDRTSATPSGGHELSSGLLRSGSYFSDAEFFALYRRVGEAIAESLGDPASTAASARGAGGDPAEKSPERAKGKRTKSVRPRAPSA